MNYYQLARVNQTRVKMNVLDTGNKNPKVETINLAHMWGFEVERAKKTIMTTTQNAVWNVPRTLTYQFWARQAMFRL